MTRFLVALLLTGTAIPSLAQSSLGAIASTPLIERTKLF
jgi:hypothetical protein